MKVGDNTRIVINATGDFEQLAYQTDDQYVIEVQKTRKVNGPVDEKREYTGERLTLNFQDIETRAVLQLLADASGQNIVVSDSVKGSVDAAPPETYPGTRPLDIVLRTQGLDKTPPGTTSSSWRRPKSSRYARSQSWRRAKTFRNSRPCGSSSCR